MAGETSQFNARADNAALALRKNLNQQGRQVADEAPVEVGPDGRPPAPPPPEGSYIAMQQPTREDVQRQQMAPEPPQRAEDVVPADEPPPSPAQQEPAEPALSANANRRIRELVDELRQKDQDLQKTAAQAAEQGQTVAQLQAQMQQMQAQYDQLVQQNLDHLDPETRMRVVQDARVQEMVAGMEQRILGKIAPHLQRFEQQTVRTEMERLGDRYPAFDVAVHGPLIEMFRGKNPACTIEQAFRAIAEPEELAPPTASAAVVPPIVAPGNGRAAPRYVQETEQRQRDPEAELVQEAQELKKLMREGSPEDRQNATRLWHEHLKRRLS